MVLILLHFSFATMKFDTKTTSDKNSYLDEEWLFIMSFKVGSVTGMINKEVLAQFIYERA